ncbi:unnamed protein product [Cochlearia groenlandica]
MEKKDDNEIEKEEDNEIEKNAKENEATKKEVAATNDDRRRMSTMRYEKEDDITKEDMTKDDAIKDDTT